MKPGRGQLPYRLFSPAAQAALRFAACRNAAGWHAAWRPVALSWRQGRRTAKGVRVNQVGPVARPVWLPQFHLHSVTRVSDGPRRKPLPGLLPILMTYQRLVVTNYRSTIVHTRAVAQQPQQGPLSVHTFASHQAPNESAVSVQGAASRLRRVRPTDIPLTAKRSARSAEHLHPGQPQTRVRPGPNARMQTILTLRNPKRESLGSSPNSTAIGSATPSQLRQLIDPQPNLDAQELVWRRSVPPAGGSAGTRRKADSPELGYQANGRSSPELGPSPEKTHPFGHAPATPVPNIDSAWMDRLTDDVIRRVERRERIERARRGL